MATEKLPLKITLKVLAYAPNLSEETYNFKADVFVDGKLVAQANNAGHGGNTNVQPYLGTDKALKAWKELETYCKALPHKPILLETSDKGEPAPLTNPDGSVVLLEQDVESVVDELFDAYVREVYIPRREAAAYRRKCKNHTVYLLHSDCDKYEHRLSMQYSASVALGIRAQFGADLKEIINERFLPEVERPGHAVYEANQKSKANAVR